MAKTAVNTGKISAIISTPVFFWETVMSFQIRIHLNFDIKSQKNQQKRLRMQMQQKLGKATKSGIKLTKSACHHVSIVFKRRGVLRIRSISLKSVGKQIFFGKRFVFES